MAEAGEPNSGLLWWSFRLGLCSQQPPPLHRFEPETQKKVEEDIWFIEKSNVVVAVVGCYCCLLFKLNLKTLNFTRDQFTLFVELNSKIWSYGQLQSAVRRLTEVVDALLGLLLLKFWLPFTRYLNGL